MTRRLVRELELKSQQKLNPNVIPNTFAVRGRERDLTSVYITSAVLRTNLNACAVADPVRASAGSIVSYGPSLDLLTEFEFGMTLGFGAEMGKLQLLS